MRHSDKEYRIVNAATEVLRDMGIALHFSLIGNVLRGEYARWLDFVPTDEQIARALNRQLNLDSGEIRVPWGVLMRVSPGVWKHERRD